MALEKKKKNPEVGTPGNPDPHWFSDRISPDPHWARPPERTRHWLLRDRPPPPLSFFGCVSLTERDVEWDSVEKKPTLREGVKRPFASVNKHYFEKGCAGESNITRTKWVVRQGVKERLEIRALQELENYCILCGECELKLHVQRESKKATEWGSEKGVLCVVLWRRVSSQEEERWKRR